MATVSSREFNQAISQDKKAAREGPRFITDRGRSAYVLMTIERYEQLLGNQPSILDLLAGPDCAEIEVHRRAFGPKPGTGCSSAASEASQTAVSTACRSDPWRSFRSGD